MSSCRGKNPAADTQAPDSSRPARTAKQAPGKWDRNSAEVEYKFLQAELRLAKLEKPYLVIDARNMKLMLKLKGAVVWSYNLEMEESGSDGLDAFVNRFRGSHDRFIRLLSGKHLFAATEKTPDSILAIVGEAVNVDPELLQRDVPEKFQLLWGGGLILEVRTDIVGKPTSRLKNTFVDFRSVLQKPFGESHLVIKMSPDEALTLYRVSRSGLPTLIFPRF